METLAFPPIRSPTQYAQLAILSCLLLSSLGYFPREWHFQDTKYIRPRRQGDDIDKYLLMSPQDNPI